MNMVFLLIFWVMQVFCHTLLKYGSTAPGRGVPCFVIANTIGMLSIVFLMLLYKTMNPNVALGLGMGGGFLFSQLAFALIFHSRLSTLQVAGILTLGLGMVMLAAGGKLAAA